MGDKGRMTSLVISCDILWNDVGRRFQVDLKLGNILKILEITKSQFKVHKSIETFKTNNNFSSLGSKKGLKIKKFQRFILKCFNWFIIAWRALHR